MNTLQVRARVERTTDVQTLPHAMAKLRRRLDEPMASAIALGEEIGKDQVLAAKVLRLVNSGFYGLRTPVTTITQAMVLLGFDVVRTLVLSASVLDIVELMNRLLAGLWGHSLATARVAHALAERLEIRDPEEVALAGLLHDLGKVIIAQRFPAEAKEIAEIMAARDCLRHEAERTVLGASHAEVGMWLLRKWGLPDTLVAPIAYHHDFRADREFADRIAIVHVANVLCRARGLGQAESRRISAIHPEAWSLLGLGMSDVEHLYGQLENELIDLTE